jgi:hypothetical protein
VDPDVLKRLLKHGVQAVFQSEPDLTRWNTVSINYYLRLVFSTYRSSRQIVSDGDYGATYASSAKGTHS